MRTATVAVLLAITAAACGSPAPAARREVPAAAHAIAPAQGAAICGDLNAWLAAAVSQDQPRFTAQLQADEREAGDANLGLHLQDLDTNLLNLNGAALMPSPPGYYPATGLADLSADCAAYGVTVIQPGSQDG